MRTNYKVVYMRAQTAKILSLRLPFKAYNETRLILRSKLASGIEVKVSFDKRLDLRLKSCLKTASHENKSKNCSLTT